MFRKARFALLGVLLAMAALARPAAAASDVLPDLQMAKLTDLKIEKTSDGHRRLRFTTVIVNVGKGAFEVLGSRSSTSDTLMSTKQRIYNTSGGYRDVSTSAVMFFAGDGHNHWHLRKLETYELDRLDNGSKAGTGEKLGFCFYDNVDFRSMSGHPANPVYKGCGNQDSLKVRTGLSIGWGDKYGSNLPDQYIDITGLKSGRYRLKATADASNWFQEVSNSNNVTWVDLDISGSGVKVIQYGPHA